MNIYIQLTKELNEGALRAIVCSGQAAVLHRIAIMSKDGDWILREDESALAHVLSVLQRHGARYRYGAPLHLRWMKGGWSAHFEFRHGALRARTDFFTRPPRIPPDRLSELWRDQGPREVPFVNAVDLAEMKKTNRERDYAVIGELARRMARVEDQILYSRSARDLIRLGEQHPELLESLCRRRGVLRAVSKGRDLLEAALDAERRGLIRANEARLEAYQSAATRWHSMWPALTEEISDLPLSRAHEIVVERAEGVLPDSVSFPAQAPEGDESV